MIEGLRDETWGFGIGIGCSAGPGNSGGAILIEPVSSEIPLFIGVVTASMGSDRDHMPFDQHNYAGGPLLQGEFYNTLSNF